MAAAKKAAKKTAKKAPAKKAAAKKTTAKKAPAKKAAAKKAPAKKATAKKATAKKAPAKKAAAQTTSPSGVKVPVSQIKERIKAAGLRTSGDFAEALNEEVNAIIDRAAKRAEGNGRSTVRPGDL